MINTRKDMKKLIQGGGQNFELLKGFCKSKYVPAKLASLSYCSLLLTPSSKDCLVTISCVTEHRIIVTWVKDGNLLEAIFMITTSYKVTCELAYNGEIIFTGSAEQGLFESYLCLLLLGAQVTSALKHIEYEDCGEALSEMVAYSQQCIYSWIRGNISNEVFMQGVIFSCFAPAIGSMSADEQSNLTVWYMNTTSDKQYFFVVSPDGCMLRTDSEILLKNTSILEALRHLHKVGFKTVFCEQYMPGYPDNLLQPEDLADAGEDQTTFFSAP